MSFDELTTISEFLHPLRPNPVTLIGNEHGGSEAYVASLRNQLDMREARGSIIHYEEVQPVDSSEVDEQHPIVQSAYWNLDFIMDFIEDSIKKSDASIYDITVSKAGTWHNHDLNALELAKLISQRPDQYVALAALTGFILKPKDSPATVREILYSKVFGTITTGAYVGLWPSLVTARNNVALRAVDSTLEERPNQEITLLWGQGHIPGIARGLLRRGFEMTRIEAYSPSEQFEIPPTHS